MALIRENLSGLMNVVYQLYFVIAELHVVNYFLR